MEISKRLRTVAEEIQHANVLADIGTDHGYVPIYAIQEKKAVTAIACDISKGPLQKAAENIEKYGLSSLIETRLGNGLQPLQKGEADAVVISGMGGMLMIDILKEKKEIVSGLDQLILQPQLDVDAVRKYLHTAGFMIENEQMILEGRQYYTVIRAVKGQEKYDNEWEYLFGKILLDRKDQTLKTFLKQELNKQEKIIKTLSSIDTSSAIQRLSAVKKEYRIYREAYQCL